MLQQDGANDAVALLQHWTGERLGASTDDWKVSVAAWQKWYAERFPDKPPAALPVEAENAKWKFDELLEYLSGDEAAIASADRGAAVFAKSQCINCHRMDGKGEILGPDLTALNKRFTRKEILQSIVYPSHVISDQFASKTILTKQGRQYSGIVAPGAAGEMIVLQADGKKVIIEEDEIDEINPRRQSAMPTGLIDSLSLQEIADLFAYLGVAPKPNLARRPTAAQPR